MKFHHLRNATFVLEVKDHRVLVDPMLGPRGSLMPFAALRFRARRNPLVDLPQRAEGLLEGVSHCLVTHSRAWGVRALQHFDHLDPAGEAFLRCHSTPLTCPTKDASYLRKFGLNVSCELEPWVPKAFLGGQITGIPALHGFGWIHHLMANGLGYLLRFPGQASVYISGDTVLTPDVERVLTEEKPDIAVLAAGQAQLDVGQPLLMDLAQIKRFCELAPGRVVANHLEALNHCPITRTELAKFLEAEGLAHKVLIPADGETLVLV